MQEHWYRDIIIVLLIVILLQWMTIYNLKSNCCSSELTRQSHLSNSSHSGHQVMSPVDVSKQTILVTSASTSSLSRGFGGVAVTTFLGSPKWYQNRYSMMINQMLATLPEDWAVQIFYQPLNKMAVEGTNYPGIQKQVALGKVILTPLPESFKPMKKNEIMLTPFVWESMKSENVLLFGGNSVLCANSPQSLLDYVRRFDYIGSPWGEFNGEAGSNALNLRKRSIILEQIYRYTNRTDVTASGVGGKKKGIREESYHAKEIISSKRYRVANKTDTYGFAMSGSIAIGTPLGSVGVLDGLSDKVRQQFIDYCPEMKMMFPSLHNPSCFGADPNILECFKYLCNDGGLKCAKVNKTVSFASKNNRKVSITIQSDE